nr:class I SAM-dependent RNA methyltransferase [Chthonobacter albigriseus]
MIERLGHRGDGVASFQGRPVFVPYTLPGERIEAEVSGDRAVLGGIIEASPDRVAPPCPQFGVCGGCVLQHLGAGPYAAFKRQLVVDALADRGLAPPVEMPVIVPPNARRRATMAGIMAGKRPIVGFHERASHQVVPIEVCFVVVPEILAGKPALEALTAAVSPRKQPLDLTVTATTAGLDVALNGIVAADVDRLRMKLIDIAGQFDLARLSARGEAIVERRPPVVMIDEIAVVPPPGGFLQASAAAEAAMGDLVVAAVGKARKVADLYAGVGTFAYRLARTATVTAAEGDAGAVNSLERGFRFAKGRNRIMAERRDLTRRPMVEKELEGFDAVVFDPPRAGAAEQCQWIARSKVRTVVAVSCNPATLARDLRILVDGGYRIESVTPIDQFLWSSHVEVVAVLRR